MSSQNRVLQIVLGSRGKLTAVGEWGIFLGKTFLSGGGYMMRSDSYHSNLFQT